MSAADNLRRAKALIEPKEGWCVLTMFRDQRGNIVHKPEHAASYCSLGALTACNIPWVNAHVSMKNESLIGKEERALLDACERRGFDFIPSMNDSSEHAGVLEVFDLAICIAECNDE